MIRLDIRPLQFDLNLRWAQRQFIGFCHDAAQIMAELLLEMTQWKHFMSASAWVQVLDFTKSLVYSNCQNDRKVFFFFFCLFLFFSFMCHVCVLSLICLFIISGGFYALHQLSLKMDPFEIQHPKLIKKGDTVHSCEIKADATFFTPPSPELRATLFSNKC